MEDNKIHYLSPKEVRAAVDNGQQVYADNLNYIFIKKGEDYYIKSLSNNHVIGMGSDDDKYLNYKEAFTHG
jgi:glyoxylate utilization-related uncharacterized protein